MRRLVRDLELEARGWRHRRDCEERVKGYASVGGGYRETFHQSGSHRYRDQSQEYADQDSISLEGRRPWNAAMDAMS